MKELTREEQIFLCLFSEAISPKQNKREENDPEEIFSWEEVFKLSVMHHISPMIYDCLGKLGWLQKVPEHIRNTWRTHAITQMVSQQNRTKQFLTLYQELKRCQLNPIVIKGIVLREIFPTPDFRTSQDEDLLIPKEDLEKYDLILRRLGFKKENSSFQDEELSYSHQETGFHLELHTKLFKSRSVCDGMNSWFTQCFQADKEIKIQGQKVRTLKDTEHMMYLIGHCFQHFACCGFGVRQLADLALYAKAYGKAIDWSKVESFTRECGLYEFWQALLSMQQQYLCMIPEKVGMPRQIWSGNLDTEIFMKDVLEGGVYGKSSLERVYSGNLMQSALSHQSSGKLSCIFRALFPSVKRAEQSYQWLEKYPYLLPVAWVFRFCKYRRKTKGRKKSATTALDIGRTRIEIARKYKITV